MNFKSFKFLRISEKCDKDSSLMRFDRFMSKIQPDCSKFDKEKFETISQEWNHSVAFLNHTKFCIDLLFYFSKNHNNLQDSEKNNLLYSLM